MGSRSSLMENRSELIGHLGNSSTYISGETSTHPEATGSWQQSPPKKKKKTTCENPFPSPFASTSDSIKDQKLLCVVMYQFITHTVTCPGMHIVWAILQFSVLWDIMVGFCFSMEQFQSRLMSQGLSQGEHSLFIDSTLRGIQQIQKSYQVRA